jgi:hypothetical protein
LTPLAMVVDASLGDGQPVAAMVRQLAEANMSKAARAARQEKQRAAEVSLLAMLCGIGVCNAIFRDAVNSQRECRTFVLAKLCMRAC